MRLFKSEKKGGDATRTENAATADYLAAAIDAVQTAQTSIGRYMKQRADAHLANTGLQTPMRMLKEVDAKLKTYVKN